MANPDSGRLSRRGLLQAGITAPLAAQTRTGARDPALIARENRKSGARDWQLTKVRLDKSGGYRTSLIEGYCSHLSIEAGETLRVMVSTNPPAKFQAEFFRMGYYGGAGARLMKAVGPLAGATQPDPPVGPERLRECRWEPSFEFAIPRDWPSGVYLGRLSRIPSSAQEHGWQSYVVFIVRDNRPADVLFQCSDNTWQAYNRWPDDYSLYTDPRHSWAPDVAVSFDRPYGKYAQIYEHPLSIGSGEFLCWEYPLVFWLEMHGYDVTYCGNADMLDGRRIQRARVFLSVGHDEYWDVRQYDSAMAGVKAGVSQLYLSGNSVFGVTPFTPSSGGVPNRIITRRGIYGGMSQKEFDAYFKYPFPVKGPDESLLMGARSVYPFNGGGDWICTKPDHWMFAGTGMRNGESVPGLVGWEFHGAPAKIPGLEIVAEGDALSGGTQPSHWTATIYPGPKGNFVFNAATIWWAQALASPPGHMLPWSHWVRPHGPDQRVQRITANLLRRALGKTS